MCSMRCKPPLSITNYLSSYFLSHARNSEAHFPFSRVCFLFLELLFMAAFSLVQCSQDHRTRPAVLLTKPHCWAKLKRAAETLGKITETRNKEWFRCALLSAIKSDCLCNFSFKLSLSSFHFMFISNLSTTIFLFKSVLERFKEFHPCYVWINKTPLSSFALIVLLLTCFEFLTAICHHRCNSNAE